MATKKPTSKKQTPAEDSALPTLAELKEFVRAEGVRYLGSNNINSTSLGFLKR